jgi:PAS domain S-box-containing protein
MKVAEQPEMDLFRLASIVETSNDYIISENFDGIILSWNKAAENILGFTAQEAIGQHISIILTPEELVKEYELLRRIKLGETFKHYKTSRLSKDGAEVPISLTISPIKNMNGEIVAISKIGRDISGQKQSEKRERELAENFQALVKAISLGVWDGDENGHSLSESKWWRDLTGQNPQTEMENWLDCVHPEDLERTTQAWYKALATKKKFDIEYRVKTSEGIYKHCHVIGVPIFNEDGSFRQWIGTFNDIDGRKKAEEEIRRSEQRIRKLIDNLFSFVGLLTSDGTLIEINRTALAAANLEYKDVLGKDFTETYWWAWSEESQKKLRETILLANKGETVRSDMVIRTGENQYMAIDFQIAPIFGENNIVTHLVPSAIDITERRRLESELNRTAQMSLAGTLAASLAHEIKNPLTGIKGAIDILSRRYNEFDVNFSILKNVQDEITRIDETVKLLLSRVKPRVMCFEPASLTETLNRAVGVARHHLLFGKSTSEIKLVSELPAESFVFPHDTAQLEDAVLNLILNAADAIGRREGQIFIRMHKSQTVSGHKYIIEISDTGDGISETDLTNIFTPFFTTKKNGTGLGLAAVKRIAEAHGGYCDVQIEAGKSTTFKLHLPDNSSYSNT